MVASLAAVVVHQLLHDMITSEGAPFKFVGASVWFTQVSFFWSPFFSALFARWSYPYYCLIIAKITYVNVRYKRVAYSANRFTGHFSLVKDLKCACASLEALIIRAGGTI